MHNHDIQCEIVGEFEKTIARQILVREYKKPNILYNEWYYIRKTYEQMRSYKVLDCFLPICCAQQNCLQRPNT